MGAELVPTFGTLDWIDKLNLDLSFLFKTVKIWAPKPSRSGRVGVLVSPLNSHPLHLKQSEADMGKCLSADRSSCRRLSQPPPKGPEVLGIPAETHLRLRLTGSSRGRGGGCVQHAPRPQNVEARCSEIYSRFWSVSYLGALRWGRGCAGQEAPPPAAHRHGPDLLCKHIRSDECGFPP